MRSPTLRSTVVIASSGVGTAPPEIGNDDTSKVRIRGRGFALPLELGAQGVLACENVELTISDSNDAKISDSYDVGLEIDWHDESERSTEIPKVFFRKVFRVTRKRSQRPLDGIEQASNRSRDTDSDEVEGRPITARFIIAAGCCPLAGQAEFRSKPQARGAW